MMLLLILNVANDRVQLRVTIRKCTKAFLPIEPPFDPAFFIDEFRGIGFDCAHQIRQCHTGFQTNQQMDVIGYTVNLNELLFVTANDACDVFVKLILELRPNQILSSLHRKNDLNVNLRISVRHRFASSKELLVQYNSQDFSDQPPSASGAAYL